jgi:hypothetical protein
MRYDTRVRTTLELDDDVIEAARKIARERRVTLGEVISELARQSLDNDEPPKMRNGVLLFAPKPGGSRSDQMVVNSLRDDE